MHIKSLSTFLLTTLLLLTLAPAPLLAQEEATAEPTAAPTEVPTDVPTEPPLDVPTEVPMEPPTAIPTEAPTEVSTEPATAAPTDAPTELTAEATAEMTPASAITMEATPLAEVTAEATLETVLLAPETLVARVEPVTEASLMVARTFVVNSTGDNPDVMTNGICDAGAGVCTLRAAIQEANFTLDKDTINFNIPGPGPHTISPATALPPIDDPIIINGASEPGYTWATPQIVLDGIGIPSGLVGLDLVGNANGSTIKGLVFQEWTTALRVYTDANLIQANFIGTSVDGGAADANAGGIMLFSGANNNTIGGTTAALRNVISGNNADGIRLMDASNLVQGNYIGTSAAGTVDLGNNGNGVWVDGSSNNTIGGTVAGARNVISGNFNGVFISGVSATSNRVQGNYIGVNALGAAGLGNSNQGVRIFNSPNNIIGGTVAGARNVISGNSVDGVALVSGATGNRVQGNYLGVKANGNEALGNGNGVNVEVNAGADNIIGGAVVGARNVISGNGYTGIIVGGARTLIAGNYIGTNALGTAPLGNAGYGIRVGSLSASGTVIGGTVTGAGNRIAYNGGHGIWVEGTANHRLLSNLIYGNTGLGINLGVDGVTPNDTGDGDAGPNQSQNYPVLTDMRGSRFTGTLNGEATSPYRIQFFASAACDVSSFGEGERYLGTAAVLTDPVGDASFNVTLPVTVTAGWRISATATHFNGYTSEFSECIVANLGIPVLVSPANNALTPDTTPEFKWNPVPNATGYLLQIALDPTFINVTTYPVAGTSYTPPALTALESYYWRAAAEGTGVQVTPWSATRRLNITD